MTQMTQMICTSGRTSVFTEQTTNQTGADAGAEGAFEPRFVSLSTGVRMEYVEHGAATGVPVVFLHGVTDSWHSFEPVLRLLPPSIRAYAVSQRGHGDSSRPQRGYRYTDFSEDVRAFLDAMGLDRAVVVGHSMGASVAQRLVVDHPGRVARLVLMGAFSTLYRNAVVSAFVASAVAPLSDPIPEAFARDWQLSTTARPVDPGFLETVVRETLKVPARVWHESFNGFLETPDFSRQLARVSVPVLLVWGERDSYAQRADQDALLAAMPHARLLSDPDAGHALHWEAPETFVASLLRFLGDSR